jgi:hypothetical protein
VANVANNIRVLLATRNLHIRSNLKIFSLMLFSFEVFDTVLLVSFKYLVHSNSHSKQGDHQWQMLLTIYGCNLRLVTYIFDQIWKYSVYCHSVLRYLINKNVLLVSFKYLVYSNSHSKQGDHQWQILLTIYGCNLQLIT